MDPLVCTADHMSLMTRCIAAFPPFCLLTTALPFMSLPFVHPTRLNWQVVLLGEFVTTRLCLPCLASVSKPMLRFCVVSYQASEVLLTAC